MLERLSQESPSSSAPEKGPREGTSHLRPSNEAEDTPTSDPKVRYSIPKSNASGRNLTTWLSENRDDRALYVSLGPFADIKLMLVFIRTFGVACLITYWPVLKGYRTLAMNTTLQI